MADAITMLTNLINPQVLADMIEQKYIDNIIFAPLARIDNTLVGQPGDTVTLPKFAYIGDAVEVGEGEDIETKKLDATSTTVTIKKVGNGASITDEAILSGYGDPMGELASQLPKTVANKVDNDCLAALNGISANMTEDVSATDTLSANVVADALTRFGEDLEGTKVLLISPKQLSQIRKDPDYFNASEIQTGAMISGAIGKIWDCDVVVSNRIKAAAGAVTNFIVKPGALAIYMKRNTLVEPQRHPKNQTTDIFITKMYTTYLYDESKAIKLITKE